MLAPACAAGILAGPAPASAFSLDDVTARALALSREEYRDHRAPVPKWMLTGSMTYDQWRDIRFNPERSLWRKDALPFQVQFFHPGLYYDRTVAVSTVDKTGVHAVPFDIGSFDYGQNDFASRIPKDIGFAGIRIHAPMRNPGYFDELVVFLGATYFRALGRDNVYGLSARGIAINTVEPSGEEFPHFVEFWLETPTPDAKDLVILALMEGPSITGAYRFDVRPGERTVIDVASRLFPRRPIGKLGIAPLTSMFFFGESSRRRFDDFRPEVHDSDGLLLHFENGEWLWRPLDNPKRVNASSLHMRNPRGFGLLQRDRDFVHYLDDGVFYERRASTWVEPLGNWGDGAVHLLEIPTDDEIHDNIAAYWCPAGIFKAGEQRTYRYKLSWLDDIAFPESVARATATWTGLGGRPGHKRPAGVRKFVIDFQGQPFAGLGRNDGVELVVTPSRGSLGTAYNHPVVDQRERWRAVFDLEAHGPEPVDIRAFLQRNGQALTETWIYQYFPED